MGPCRTNTPSLATSAAKACFCGAELVRDRSTKEPVAEKVTQAVVADCMGQGVIIGATNRSIEAYNNTLCLSPALISTRDDIDQIVTAIDGALETSRLGLTVNSRPPDGHSPPFRNGAENGRPLR